MAGCPNFSYDMEEYVSLNERKRYFSDGRRIELCHTDKNESKREISGEERVAYGFVGGFALDQSGGSSLGGRAACGWPAGTHFFVEGRKRQNLRPGVPSRKAEPDSGILSWIFLTVL